MATVSIRDVRKSFGDVDVIQGISIEIASGEFVVIVGPSGCGKSTLLRMIAGLETVTSGVIAIDGRVVNELEPMERNVAMVFQNYALYPHLSVYDNMAYGLKILRLPKARIAAQVQWAAETLGLTAFLKRKPRELSGGQRQRVAMGRAIVREPAVFLFDEPLSNLDAKLRVQMRAELQMLHQRLRTTTLYVTHDQVEAMTLADRMVVMSMGRAEQVGTPAQVYGAPATTFVAGFIGSPSMNLVEAQVADAELRFAGTYLPVPPDRDLAGYEGRTIVLGIRPSDFQDAALVRDASMPAIDVHVNVVEELGAEMNVIFVLDAPSVVTDATRAIQKEAGETHTTLVASLDPSRSAVCTAQVDAHSRIRAGEAARLAIDVDGLRFFDKDTGLAVGEPPSGEPVATPVLDRAAD